MTRSSRLSPVSARMRSSCPSQARSCPPDWAISDITTFSDDYSLMAKIWDRYMKNLIDNDVPGLIIDLRSNSGGSLGLAMDFAGYFFDKEIDPLRRLLLQPDFGSVRGNRFPDQDQTRPTLSTRVRSRCWSARIASAPARALPMRCIRTSARLW